MRPTLLREKVAVIVASYKTSHPLFRNITTAVRFAEPLCATFPRRRGSLTEVFGESRCLTWVLTASNFTDKFKSGHDTSSLAAP